MNILTKLFGKSKTVSREVAGIGSFVYYKDKADEYWMIEHTVLSLPAEFDFGTISGSENHINPNAIKCFKKLASQPSKLFQLIDQSFLEIASQDFPDISHENTSKEFFIKALTVTDENSFEFSLHSRSKDIVIELFVRNNVIAEVYRDEGCCSPV